ncbi:MAG: tRNA pseudouridine(55) synthase TruB [Bdellovibrionales bacterium]|nr:tRNA pseudouridine(55) synthase TruB [Bdellovibrionales bacterium]
MILQNGTNGLLLIDKPMDFTSHDVVARLRKILRQKTIGHTGTLDPIATGLMVVVLGDATKLSDYLTAEDKAYEVKVRLGVTTDSLDRTGKILSETPCDLTESVLRQAVTTLEGEFEWPIPLFSAAKVDGKKLYELGREGRTLTELPTKLMRFWDVRMLASAPTVVSVRMDCSKGSFIRTWASQLGEKLGVGGTVDELRRTRVGGWNVTQAVTLDALEAAGGDLKAAGTAFIPMSEALPGLKTVMAGPKEIKLVGNGQIPRDIENRLIVEQKRAFELGKSVFVKVISDAGQLLAILAAEPGQGLRIKRVFRTFA